MISSILFSILSVMPGAWAANLSEGQIAKIMKTANQGEIDAAKKAMEKAQSAEVKAYAEKMAREHTQNTGELEAVMADEEITAKDAAKAASLEMDAKRKMQTLSKTGANAFDKVYMQTQVDMHETLLRDLDKEIIPAADDDDLRAYLMKTRAHVAEHLEEARKIRSALK